MPFIKVGQLLNKSVKKAGITKQLDSVKILNDFNDLGRQIFGEEIMKKIKPLYLKEGTLAVACLSSVLAEKLKVSEKGFLAKLNRPYKKKIVERLRFLV